MTSSWFYNLFHDHKIKKTSSPKQAQEEVKDLFNGSMTVEAALVLPLFLFTVLSLSFLIELVRIQVHIGCAMGQVSKELAAYGYTYSKLKEKIKEQGNEERREEKDKNSGAGIRVETLPGIILAQSRLVDLIGEDFLDSSIVVNGSGGLNLIGTEILKDDTWIKLVVSYKVKLPFSVFPDPEIKVIQHSCSHAWLGCSYGNIQGEDKTTIVYMTEHGSRYHLSRGCKYLNIRSRYVTKDEIFGCRNRSGGKYYPCHRCMGKAEGYFITEYGNSYHTRSDCTAISRNIIEKRLEEVEDIFACCKECGKER